jgi:hypothetical protein
VVFVAALCGHLVWFSVSIAFSRASDANGSVRYHS